MLGLHHRALARLIALGTVIVLAGCGDDSTSPGTIVDTTPPATPSGLTVTPTGENLLVVEWDDNSEADLAGYILEKSELGSEWQDVSGLLSTSAFEDAVATRVDYRVRSTDLVGNESGTSGAVTYVAPPSGGPKIPARAR